MSTPATHELKTWEAYFQPVWLGEKTFDIRYDDRAFQKGDLVVLREWDWNGRCQCFEDPTIKGHTNTCARYSGREIHARIGHVAATTPARGSQRGFSGNGYVVLALVDRELIDGRPRRRGIAAVASASGLPTDLVLS